MELTQTQKDRLKILLEMMDKDKAELVWHILEMSDKFQISQESWDKIAPDLEKLQNNLDTLKPKKGVDYATPQELKDIRDEILSILPKPKTVNEKEILQRALDEMTKRIKMPKDGKDAVVDYNFVVKEVTKNIKIPENGKDGSPDTPNEIISKINKSDKKIKSDKIEGLEQLKRLDDIEKLAKANALPITTSFINGVRAKNITFQGTALDGVEYVGDTAVVHLSKGGGSGGGAVDSVNGETGDVILDADDIDDTSTTNKFVTADDLTNLDNLSGTNTGDQDLSGYELLSNKDTDGTLSANSDTKYASQKAVKTYVDDHIGGSPGGTDTELQFNNSGAFGGARLAYTESGNNSRIQHTGSGIFDLVSSDGGNFALTGIDGSDYSYIGVTGTFIGMRTPSGEYSFDNGNDIGDAGILDFSNVGVGGQTFTLPDASGTVALTSDIPDVSGYELLSNKATDFSTVNDTLYPSVEAVQEYVNSAVVGLLDYRGTYDASTNLYPATGGSGIAGVILKGDFWIVSVAGTLGGTSVTAGDLVIALVDTPAQTSGNWDLVEHDLGYAPEDSANKVTSISGSSTDIQYPSAKLLYDKLALKRDLDKRVGSTTNNATLAVDSDTYDEYYLTAMSADTAISITGTPEAGRTIFLGLKDDGTPRALSFTSIGVIGVDAPTTTTSGKITIVGIKYIMSAWYIISVATEA